MYMLCTKVVKNKLFTYGSYRTEIVLVGIWHQVKINNVYPHL